MRVRATVFEDSKRQTRAYTRISRPIRLYGKAYGINRVHSGPASVVHDLELRWDKADTLGQRANEAGVNPDELLRRGRVPVVVDHAFGRSQRLELIGFHLRPRFSHARSSNSTD